MDQRIRLNSAAELNAIVAALTLYRNEGFGDPGQRPDYLHEIATGEALGTRPSAWTTPA